MSTLAPSVAAAQRPFVVPHRYLVRFRPKQLPHYFTDVLVIGGGLAGMSAALSARSDQQVLVVTKDALDESNSAYAQGGIAGVLDPDDRFESHIDDTLSAGMGLCDRAVVEQVVRSGPERIEALVRWGTHFDQENGRLALTQEGGHSHRRVAHALGDATGKEVMRAVLLRARSAANLSLWENTFTLDLLTADGRCHGALVSRGGEGKMCVWAKQTILASGGAGQLFRETTNPDIATADGHAMAYRAGAELRDMEFMQFHPTVLYIAGSSRSLITEAVRGEGAYLRDRSGHRFMPEYHASAELAPRDVVSRAITEQMARTKHPNVYLDLSHLEADHVRRRFPMIARVCSEFGIDITCDLIPVRPGAHYMIGGVTADLEGRTTLPGLWAAGEVTSSGLHGANRLGSNSLLEGLVFGSCAGKSASEEAARTADRFQALPLESDFATDQDDALDLEDIRNSLSSLLWRHAGIVRDRSGLEEAEQAIAFWSRYVLAREFHDPQAWELQNLLTAAGLLVSGALTRQESRGVHFRSDFPETDDAHWRRHITACFCLDHEIKDSENVTG